jgi:hypothetical protein
MKKTFLILLALILVGAAYGYFNYFFSRGNGVKSGVLIQFQQEGTMFKTYEGEVASQALRNMTNKSFKFSVLDQKIADSLMKCTDKEITVHFEKFKGSLPWRGANYLVHSTDNGSNEPCAQYIVDRIESVKDANGMPVQGLVPQSTAPVPPTVPAPASAPVATAPASAPQPAPAPAP